MRERLFIFGSIALLVSALVALNAASYVQKEKIPDSEAMPHRSTYNTGPTGIRAFHDLLVSTGKKVKRWESPISELVNQNDAYASTFVIVGATRREITDDEVVQLLEWVHDGGMLVLIDRDPLDALLKTTGSWTIRTSKRQDAISESENEMLLSTVDPANSKQMTDGEKAAKPFQPTAITGSVNAVQPSKFAASIVIKKASNSENSNEQRTARAPSGVPSPVSVEKTEDDDSGSAIRPGTRRQDNTAPAGGFVVEPEPDDDKITATTQDGADDHQATEDQIDYSILAPVIHMGNDKKNLLAEFPYGYGSIAILTDPYLISNGGVNLVDNAALGVNLVSRGGMIAFDEYHQGYGSDQNRLLTYFTGTPVIPVFLQFCLLIGLVMVSQSRRFARPLPMREPNRLSKLEYVAAMAQLKSRTKAFDLAVENIYTDFRRRISRLAGVENSRSRVPNIADWIASRTDFTQEEINVLIMKCEEIMHGEPTNKKEVLALTTKIREIEKALGLRRERVAFRK